MNKTFLTLKDEVTPEYLPCQNVEEVSETKYAIKNGHPIVVWHNYKTDLSDWYTGLPPDHRLSEYLPQKVEVQELYKSYLFVNYSPSMAFVVTWTCIAQDVILEKEEKDNDLE